MPCALYRHFDKDASVQRSQGQHREQAGKGDATGSLFLASLVAIGKEEIALKHIYCSLLAVSANDFADSERTELLSL